LNGPYRALRVYSAKSVVSNLHDDSPPFPYSTYISYFYKIKKIPANLFKKFMLFYKKPILFMQIGNINTIWKITRQKNEVEKTCFQPQYFLLRNFIFLLRNFRAKRQSFFWTYRHL